MYDVQHPTISGNLAPIASKLSKTASKNTWRTCRSGGRIAGLKGGVKMDVWKGFEGTRRW